jgi:predicted Zn-dependent protease
MRFSRRAINGMSRREFLIMTSMAATGLAVGCATNPVTGKSQFMIMSEQQEIAVDRQQSPHQFSSDYGTTQDRALQSYVQATGKRHGPQYPSRADALQFSLRQRQLRQCLRLSRRKHRLYPWNSAGTGQ